MYKIIIINIKTKITTAVDYRLVAFWCFIDLLTNNNNENKTVHIPDCVSIVLLPRKSVLLQQLFISIHSTTILFVIHDIRFKLL